MSQTFSRFTCLAALSLGTTLFSMAHAGTNVGVSVSVDQPGFYGRVDIGQQAPAVIYAQPVIIQRGAIQQRPIYMRVPIEHSRDWAHHCARYQACGQPVYFVQEGHEGRGHDHHDHGRHEGRRDRQDERRDDYRDDRRDDRREERGNGRRNDR